MSSPNILLTRIDNRLVHGQVGVTWTSTIGANLLVVVDDVVAKEGANKRGNSSRLTQSFHFFMFEPIFSPVNALN
ncbi:PTS sugar transporter subunit IIB, partial [Escherichia coli]|nr:PTS sugar transporter subunit IIB [Escherichia coli]